MDQIVKVSPKVLAQLWNSFIRDSKDLLSATKYLSPNLVARLVRKRRNKNVYNKRKPTIYVINNTEDPEFILTIGRPNYLERRFIKHCKNAGEPFPVKNVIKKFDKRR